MISHLDQCVFYVQFLFCTLILSCNKKKMLEAVCIGEQDVVFSVCSFSVFFLCVIVIFINDKHDFPIQYMDSDLFFVSCYWRIIHLIYVIFPLHFVIYKQYCFFLSPVQRCDHFVVVNFVKF